MEERIKGSNKTQQAIVQMVSEMSEDLRAALGVDSDEVVGAQALLWVSRCQDTRELYL